MKTGAIFALERTLFDNFVADKMRKICSSGGIKPQVQTAASDIISPMYSTILCVTKLPLNPDPYGACFRLCYVRKNCLTGSRILNMLVGHILAAIYFDVGPLNCSEITKSELDVRHEMGQKMGNKKFGL